MKLDLKRFQDTFFEEAAEHLATMEAGLLDLETRSSDAELLNTIFRAAHSIKGGSASFGFKEIAHFTHALENVLDRLRAGRLAAEPALTSLLLESADLLRDLVEATRGGEPGAVAIDETVAALEAALAPAAAASAPAAAPGAGAGPVVERRQSGDPRGDTAAIRVPTEKVDALVNLVGEIIIAQATVNQLATGMTGEALVRMQEALAVVDHGMRDLQEKVLSIRMLPIGSVFNRFPRIVRDLAQSMGKRVRLETAGTDIELDKGVIERLGDPLTHLVRNALDHGLEPPGERVRRGKPEEGLVRLRAFHEGGNVIIEILDDGRGLDRERIREEAVSQGLVRPDAVLSDEDVHALLFRPGFSTAKAVTDVSGRGVGMDVVKRNVEALDGAISVSSVPGQGCCFRIRLPLTLVLLDGLSAVVGQQPFMVPLLSFAQSVRPKPGDIHTVPGGRAETFLLRGEQVPLLRLHQLLDIAGAVTDPCQGIVMVLESDGCRFGVLVDDVLGQSQVVIKSLERGFCKVDAVMGATTMGDGRVALIVDVPELHRIATRRRGDADARAMEAGAESGASIAAGAGSSVSVR